MAGNADRPLGTDALQTRVAAARAAQGAAAKIPAPPADASASPWAGPVAPSPESVRVERAKQADAARDPMQSPMDVVLAEQREQPRKPQPRSRRHETLEPAAPVIAFRIVDKVLSEWAKTAKTNPGRANADLARHLAMNGAVLIQHEYPIETLLALISGVVNLTRNARDEIGESVDVLKLKELLTREIEGDGRMVGGAADANGDDDDDGE